MMRSSSDSLGVLGIVGGGQLARFTALAARSMGFRVRILDPDPSCPAAAVVDEAIAARFDDITAARALAKACDVVTLDLEHVPLKVLDAMAQHTFVRPSLGVMAIVQNRVQQKQWLSANGFPVGPFSVATGAAELKARVAALGPRVYVKASRGGFDGRGQQLMNEGSSAEQTLAALGTEDVIVESALPLQCELSVLVARRPNGEAMAYPPAQNYHRNGVLEWSLLPSTLPSGLCATATSLALSIAHSLGAEGLCTVEMFLHQDGRLLVNEIAPRPHNSYHASDRAFETSQFEQHVRAVFDLPLGVAGDPRATALANLLGDLWLRNVPPDFGAALKVRGVRAHLYGKATPRPGRKLGHLTASGATAEEALHSVQQARAALVGKGSE